MDKNFYLDRVKHYLDGVFAGEEHINTYAKCAEDIYRVYNNKAEITLKDVDNYLRGLAVGVDYDSSKTCVLAREFAKDLKSLTMTTRSADDVYWWALSTAVWVYGGMGKENPQFRG